MAAALPRRCLLSWSRARAETCRSAPTEVSHTRQPTSELQASACAHGNGGTQKFGGLQWHQGDIIRLARSLPTDRGRMPAQVQIPAAQLAEGTVIEGWFTLMDQEGLKPMKDRHHQEGILSIVIQYQNVLQVASSQTGPTIRNWIIPASCLACCMPSCTNISVHHAALMLQWTLAPPCINRLASGLTNLMCCACRTCKPCLLISKAGYRLHQMYRLFPSGRICPARAAVPRAGPHVLPGPRRLPDAAVQGRARGPRAGDPARRQPAIPPALLLDRPVQCHHRRQALHLRDRRVPARHLRMLPPARSCELMYSAHCHGITSITTDDKRTIMPTGIFVAAANLRKPTSRQRRWAQRCLTAH